VLRTLHARVKNRLLICKIPCSARGFRDVVVRNDMRKDFTCRITLCFIVQAMGIVEFMAPPTVQKRLYFTELLGSA